MIASNVDMRLYRFRRSTHHPDSVPAGGQATRHAWLKVLSLSAARNPAPRGSWMFRILSRRPPLNERLPVG